MYTHHRDEKEGDLAQGDTGQVRLTKEASRRDITELCRLSSELVVVVVVVRVGMLLTGLADTEELLEDERCTVQWFITSVCGGGGTEELQIHAFPLNHDHAKCY